MAKRIRKVQATTEVELARMLGGLDVFGRYSLEYVSDDTKKLSKKADVKLEKVCVSGVNITKKAYSDFVNADGTKKTDVQPLWGGYGQRLSPALAGHFASVDESEHTFEKADKYYLYIFSPDKEPRTRTTKYLVNGMEVSKAEYFVHRDKWILPSELKKIADRKANQSTGVRAPLMVELKHVKKLKRGNVVFTL